MTGRLLLAAAGLAGLGLLLEASSLGQEPPAAPGKDLFERRCGGCHALDRDKEGPRLGDVYGRRAGSVNTFEYSEALRASNIRWNEETLEKWLAGPGKLVPNTDMAFHVEKAEEREQIIGFLKASSSKKAGRRIDQLRR